MKYMDDSEYSGTAAGDSRFEVDRPDSWVASRSASAVPVQVARALSKVADPELREIMGIVLEEDADLITYLKSEEAAP
jgi:hypothetical protein